MKVKHHHMFTGEETEMDLNVTNEQMEEFALPVHRRRRVQEIFPNLSLTEREFLLTGMTPIQQDAFYNQFEK